MPQQVSKTVCPLDCPDACSVLATVEDGRVTRLAGDPEHPFTRGFLCHKVMHYDRRLYSPLRVLYPARRVGPKGPNAAARFERISWDQALDEIVARFRSIAAEYGAEAILPYSYGGSLGIVQRFSGHRFFIAWAPAVCCAPSAIRPPPPAGR